MLAITEVMSDIIKVDVIESQNPRPFVSRWRVLPVGDVALRYAEAVKVGVGVSEVSAGIVTVVVEGEGNVIMIS